jgi:hypothetical protein
LMVQVRFATSHGFPSHHGTVQAVSPLSAEWKVNWSCLRRERIQLRTFLPSALDGGEWSASHPGRFTSAEETPTPTEKEVVRAPQGVCTF